MSIETLAPRRRLKAAREIAKTLLPSEDSLDASIVANARLVAAIAQGRLDAGVAAEVGAEALGNAIAALGALGEARARTVVCHQQLTVQRDVFGMDGSDVGCNLGKYQDSPKTSLAAHAA